ncbi:probable ergosterol biosynthetic protein 28 [Manacus vitellinus]|uniref:probable ergosterol biosynthetic protein 28 n=1 Tax=Manacus vitellinus TaxID=328815 RepID=UPI00115CA4A5|nr:probable ergosterol biosynthetic protein 28 [Manacus vitellinus]
MSRSTCCSVCIRHGASSRGGNTLQSLIAIHVLSGDSCKPRARLVKGRARPPRRLAASRLQPGALGSLSGPRPGTRLLRRAGRTGGDRWGHAWSPCAPSFLCAVNELQARTFGVWTLLSSVIRCLCAIDIRNRTLYHITLFTFFLALAHFLSEVFIYHTAALTIGVMAPLMVASFSIMGMLIGLQYLEVEALSQNKKKN